MLTIMQTQPHPDPVVREASISDLFFNHEHENLMAFYRETDVPSEARADDPADVPRLMEEDRAKERAALLLDAKAFADTLDRATGLKVDPEALVDDFFNRV